MLFENTEVQNKFVQFESALLKPYALKLISGFTGKPFSFGGLGHVENPSTTIRVNQEILLAWLASEAKQPCHEFIFPKQIHGADIKTVGQDNINECDALIITTPCQPVYVATADCVPVILYSPERHVGAVIHAGWRGTAQKITSKTLVKLKTQFDVHSEDVIAVIGPSISMPHYQVSNDVAEALALSLSKSISDLILLGLMQQDDATHYKVDLKRINALQLQAEGCTQLEISPDCTWQDNQRYFSRRKGDPQNQIAFLMLL